MEISSLNPITYREITSTQAAQYNSRHMDSFTFEQSILPWQYRTCYIQPFQRNDSLRQQVTSIVGPIATRMYNPDGRMVAEIPWQQKQQDRFQPGRFIYESVYALSNLPEGYYNPVLVIAGVELHEGAAWIDLKNLHQNTILWEYSNTRKKYGFHFQASNMVPYLRVHGALLFDKKSSVDAIYTDPEENSELLSSMTYRVWKLLVGGPSGMPDFMIDKLSDILSLNETRIEGRFYVKASEGGEFELKESDAGRLYPKRGMSIELRERLNKHEFISLDDVQQVQRAAVVYNVEEKGFGPAGQPGQIGTILNYE